MASGAFSPILRVSCHTPRCLTAHGPQCWRSLTLATAGPIGLLPNRWSCLDAQSPRWGAKQGPPGPIECGRGRSDGAVRRSEAPGNRPQRAGVPKGRHKGLPNAATPIAGPPSSAITCRPCGAPSFLTRVPGPDGPGHILTGPWGLVHGCARISHPGGAPSGGIPCRPVGPQSFPAGVPEAHASGHILTDPSGLCLASGAFSPILRVSCHTLRCLTAHGPHCCRTLTLRGRRADRLAPEPVVLP